MIISRTPFRISFFGGGTDYPVWYLDNGGAVLSTTINKYCYISTRYLPPFFPYKYRIRYTVREETGSIAGIKHPAVRECLEFMKINKGIEMVHTSDLPARSGIASSSSFTVGFLNTLNALKGNIVTKRQLARDAIFVERQLLKENVGSQDQVAVSFGGLNRIEFGGEKDFFVYPIAIEREKIELFEKSLMLFYTGISRNSSDIASAQIKNTSKKNSELKALNGMVDSAVEILNGKKSGLYRLGELLDESWKIKRRLSKLVTNREIDSIYETAMRSGALGGKLLGAGGGGFILFYARPQDQEKIKKKLNKLLHVPFSFDKLGSHIVLYATQDFY